MLAWHYLDQAGTAHVLQRLGGQIPSSLVEQRQLLQDGLLSTPEENNLLGLGCLIGRVPFH